jgi:hypothetical protein
VTADQRELLEKARESIAAARRLLEAGYAGFAASRVYYAIYAAEALLDRRGNNLLEQRRVAVGEAASRCPAGRDRESAGLAQFRKGVQHRVNELIEIRQVLLEKLVYLAIVHLGVDVDEEISEARHALEALGELRR